MRTPDAMLSRSGQALVELLVSLVCLLVVLGALLQFISLGKAQSDVMAKAREEAGALAMMPTGGGAGIITGADYIRHWSPGSDASRHSADDSFSTASPSAFDSMIVERAAPVPADWAYINACAGNDLSAIRGSPAPAGQFSLLEGDEDRMVDVLPAVQHLLYDKPVIKVEGRCWMTWTRGIY